MANIIVDQGLERAGDTLFQTSGYSASRYPRTMSIDDSVTALAAGTTTLGSPSNQFDVAFDATPTRSGQVVSMTATIPKGSGLMTARRMTIHDDVVGNVNGSSSTLFGGIDNQTILINGDFALKITMTVTTVDAS